MNELFAQIDASTLVPQLGFGGVLCWIIARRLESMEVAMKSLAKAIYLDLSERARPGSFAGEEAKRMLAKDRVKADASED